MRLFHFLALMNNAIMNEDMQVSPKDAFFNSFENTSKSGIAGSCGCSVVNSLRIVYVHSVSCNI
jgi:hypothetical protein